MKRFFKLQYFGFFICSCLLLAVSCKKESFITSGDALLRTSEDTLHFDTVFTTLGSTTQYLKLFNQNDAKLNISSIELMGGAASFFKLNVDGLSGTSFKNIEMEANDSLYFFATVRIDPNIANLPFLVRDSIKILFNGNTKWIQLEAYGKNAKFMRDVVISQNTTLPNDTPIIILGSLIVNQGETLTIQKGTNIYIHPNAPIIIDGTLKAIGDTGAADKIVFQGIRIDDPYKDYPGSWPGIYFRDNSKDNLLQYCILKNAYQGTIAINPSTNIINPKLTLNECVFDNIYNVAIGGNNSSITGRNCLVSNVGTGFAATSGGNYTFNHCTFVSISNYYLSHKDPLIILSNSNSDNILNNLNLSIDNSIVYGEGGFVDDEIQTLKKSGANFIVNMKNILYKHKTIPADIIFTNPLNATDPLFTTIDYNKRIFDFRLKAGSPCIDAATGSTLTSDLDGKPRPVNGVADIGCYEKQ